MSAIDLLGFWFPLTGVLMLGLLWLLLRDTLRTPPGGDGVDGGGSDRVPGPRRPWSWRRRGPRGEGPARGRPRRRIGSRG